MPFRIVQSKQNARLKQLRRALAQPPAREGRVLAGIEGPNLLEEALRAGLRIDCVFAGSGIRTGPGNTCSAPETEILLLPKDMLESALTTETPQPIAALVEPPDWTWAHVLGPQRRLRRWSSYWPAFRIPATLAPSCVPPRHLAPTASRSARHRQRLEPEGCARVGGKRLSPAATDGERRGMLRSVAGGRREDMRIDRAHDARPAEIADLAGAVALLIGNEGSGVPLTWLDEQTERSQFPAPARSKA